MSAKRGDRVAPPPGPGEWDVRYLENAAVDGWEELCRQAPANTNAAWVTMRQNPDTRTVWMDYAGPGHPKATG